MCACRVEYYDISFDHIYNILSVSSLISSSMSSCLPRSSSRSTSSSMR